MKILSGWFATLGVSGGVALAGVLAIGGGTVALHQSSLLIRSHAMPLVIQPVSTVSSSNGATQADDRGVDANQAADDRAVDASEPADDRGMDANEPTDDRGVAPVATPVATAEAHSGSDRGPSGSVQPSATSSPSGSDDRGGDSHGGGSSSDDGK
jgi:hypothetical protein